MKSILTLLLLAAYVVAHGQLYQVVIDNVTYPGNIPGTNPNPSIIRQISTIDPVKGADNPNINCGQNDQSAAQVGEAMPGSFMSFDWRVGNLSNLSQWPHNIGPMMTYMTSCGRVTCDKFNPVQAKWFLIDRAGRFPNGTWGQQTLMDGRMTTVQIPPNLKAGNYILRYEIIALHLATSLGGAEFYPACVQLHVGGTEEGVPDPADLVSFPGAYKDSDPGIFDPNVFNSNMSYTFPGPPIASITTNTQISGALLTQAPTSSLIAFVFLSFVLMKIY